MKQIIEELYKFNRCLLGEGYDNALEYLSHLIDLKIYGYLSGTKVENWTVPQEWIIRDAWVKHKGKKVLDYKKNPLCLVVGSIPFSGKVKLADFKKHLHTTDIEGFDMDSPEMKEQAKKLHAEKWKATPYGYNFYDKDWGFCISRQDIEKFDGKEYEVFIDVQYKPGVMKIAEHTIPGETDREILLFAHLDHPYQANDNLSGVAVLVDMAKKLKGLKHTVKIIFCPETIGSIAYASMQDMSKVDFVIALDIVGNDNSLMVQKSFNEGDKINWATHLALQSIGKDYRRGEFRFLIGSDEYFFNDPKVGIPGLLVTRYPYNEYHTELDTPKIIVEKKLKETQEFILKVIEIMEKNYIPQRIFKGPLMRSQYKLQSFSKEYNRILDYFYYMMDGERDVITLCVQSGLGWENAQEVLKVLTDEGVVYDTGKKPESKIIE